MVTFPMNQKLKIYLKLLSEYVTEKENKIILKRGSSFCTHVYGQIKILTLQENRPYNNILKIVYLGNSFENEFCLSQYTVRNCCSVPKFRYFTSLTARAVLRLVRVLRPVDDRDPLPHVKRRANKNETGIGEKNFFFSSPEKFLMFFFLDLTF